MTPLFYQLGIAITTQLAAFSAGAGMGFPAVLLYQLRKKDSNIPLDLDTSSWIGSTHGLAGIPAIIAPVIMQWKGRKLTFIAGCIVMIIGWVLVYLANSVAMILLSETLHGFGANILVTVSYDCLSEMITPSYRNVAVMCYTINHSIGLATAAIMTKFVYWRTQSIILCLPAIIALLMSCAWLESPLWLAYKEDLDKCKTNFTKIRGNDEHSVKELQEVLAALRENSRIKSARVGDTVMKQFFRQVASRDFLIPALHVFLLLNHSYWSGTIVVLIYSIELISKTTQNETAAFIGGIIINVVVVIGCIISSALIKFFNNKPVILGSTCIATTCLLCISIVTYLQDGGILAKESLLSLYFIIGFVVTTSFGQASVVFTMSSEIMPVKHRGVGGALFVIFTCSLHASSLKMSPYLFVYLGMWGTFIIFTLNSTVCGFLIWKFIPETKGKTLQEIENFYAHGIFDIKYESNEETELVKNDKICE